MSASPLREISLQESNGCWVGIFPAMASDCEIQCATTDRALAEFLVVEAAKETWRIHDKYSRYLNDNIIARINTANGKPVETDEETAALIDFAVHCYQLSDGLFDISSGILRKVWRFDGSNRVPKQSAVNELLPLIGLNKIKWDKPRLVLQAGMELDFGGIGKEYAVDKVLRLLTELSGIPILINFGGDIAANRAPNPGRPWQVGISTLENASVAGQVIALDTGGIATSGDTHRHLVKDGIRYSHILSPLTGWPVIDAPHSISVHAPSCTDAGVLATLAMLKGPNAETFLESEGITFYCQR